MNFTYKKENGVIVSADGHGLHFVPGNPGSVEFPEEVIWEIHKKSPGLIHELAHTHPIGMWELSGRDKQTLKTWAFAMYPYPVRLSVITYLRDTQQFHKVTALAILEAKETWINRGKEGKRNFNIIVEENLSFDWTEWKPAWMDWLISESYQQVNS